MKKIILFFPVLVIITLLNANCKKSDNNSSCDTPSSTAPAGLVGTWANGFVSNTEIVDAYNGQYLGNAWRSGVVFTFTSDGKNAEFVYTAEGSNPPLKSITKAKGNIAFDAGSTEQNGAFTLSPCWAHYNGWNGTSKTVDRDATSTDLQNLTNKYYYILDNSGSTTWLRIEPGGAVNTYSKSFRKL